MKESKLTIDAELDLRDDCPQLVLRPASPPSAVEGGAHVGQQEGPGQLRRSRHRSGRPTVQEPPTKKKEEKDAVRDNKDIRSRFPPEVQGQEKRHGRRQQRVHTRPAAVPKERSGEGIMAAAFFAALALNFRVAEAKSALSGKRDGGGCKKSQSDSLRLHRHVRRREGGIPWQSLLPYSVVVPFAPSSSPATRPFLTLFSIFFPSRVRECWFGSREGEKNKRAPLPFSLETPPSLFPPSVVSLRRRKGSPDLLLPTSSQTKRKADIDENRRRGERTFFQDSNYANFFLPSPLCVQSADSIFQ